MTTTSNITGNPTGLSSPSVPVAPSSASSASSAASNKPLVQASTTSISPRFVSDPTAGIIIQYLNSSGQVENQIPSANVVAYLRAGLTAQGLPKPQNTEA